jgi:hypothetical protein
MVKQGIIWGYFAVYTSTKFPPWRIFVKIRFTEKWFDRIQAPPPGRRTEYQDAQTAGLYIRHYGPWEMPDEDDVTRRARASITFVWRRTSEGKSYARTLGKRSEAFDLDAARRQAQKLNVLRDGRKLDAERARRKKK